MLSAAAKPHHVISSQPSIVASRQSEGAIRVASFLLLLPLSCHGALSLFYACYQSSAARAGAALVVTFMLPRHVVVCRASPFHDMRYDMRRRCGNVYVYAFAL